MCKQAIHMVLPPERVVSFPLVVASDAGLITPRAYNALKKGKRISIASREIYVCGRQGAGSFEYCTQRASPQALF